MKEGLRGIVMSESLLLVGSKFESSPPAVYEGQAAPWFNQPGGGTQHYSPVLNQEFLQTNGFITQLEP